MINIAFTGGGTGGHIYPGLAVAAELQKRLQGEYRLFWIGSSAGMDRSIVESEGIDFFGVPSGKLRRYFSFKNIIDTFKILSGFLKSKKILKKQKATLLFSKGGFVSVPPCAAAAALRIPVFTHESDFSPGLATKINIRFVKRTGGKIFTTYEDTERFFSPKIRDRVILSGNPVRDVFREGQRANSKEEIEEGKKREGERIILVLGGSQGAQEINELVLETLPQLTKYYTVVHQFGSSNKWNLQETERYKPYPYIKDELPFIMKAAEIILGRSGAGIWEWAVCGKPMILIPLSGTVSRGDQWENARYFEKAGAAVVLKKKTETNSCNGGLRQVLAEVVEDLANNAAKREAMAAASLKIGEKNGAAIIADVLVNQLGGNVD